MVLRKDVVHHEVCIHDDLREVKRLRQWDDLRTGHERKPSSPEKN